jgi:hypothetical protein
MVAQGSTHYELCPQQGATSQIVRLQPLKDLKEARSLIFGLGLPCKGKCVIVKEEKART